MQVFSFYSNPVFATINVSKFRDGGVHFRISGVKGLSYMSAPVWVMAELRPM